VEPIRRGIEHFLRGRYGYEGNQAFRVLGRARGARSAGESARSGITPHRVWNSATTATSGRKTSGRINALIHRTMCVEAREGGRGKVERFGYSFTNRPLKERFERAERQFSRTYLRKLRHVRLGVAPYPYFEMLRDLYAAAGDHGLFAEALQRQSKALT
jgi:hypothetical protein